MTQTGATEAKTQALPWSEERELVGRCRTGDVEAFDRLIVAYQDSVYGLAYRLMGDHDDASDLAQEVFIACFRKIGQFRGDSRVRTWLYRITVNLAKNAWKRRQRRGQANAFSLDEPLPGGEEGPPRDPPSQAPSPVKQAQDREAAASLWRCLDILTPEHREALVLRCIQDLSYEEIAEVTECNLGTVKSRINRAREEMRRLMKEHL